MRPWAWPEFRCEIDDLVQHIDEETGKRQVRPGRVRRDMEQNDHALAVLRGGHQRRAINEMRPGLSRYVGIWLGQNLAAHRHLARHLEADEGALRIEGRQPLRRLPRQRAAKHAPAPPQPHGDKIVRRRREPCAGKAQQNAALLDELREQRMIGVRQGADIGEDHHRGVLIEQRGDGIGRARPHLAHVGEGRQRFAQIIIGRQ